MTYKGFIVENGEIVGKGSFSVVGEMADGTKCYHRVEDGWDYSTAWGLWFSRSVQAIEGKRFNFFFLEAFDGSKADLENYFNELRRQAGKA